MSITLTPTRPSNGAAVAASARVRGARSLIRRRVLAGELNVAGLIRDCPQTVHGMRAFEVVQLGWPSNRSGGAGQSRRRHLELLAVAAAQEQVNLFREVQRLSDRQRAWLVGWLVEHPYRRQPGRARVAG